MYFGSGDGSVYALDVATGAVKWKFKTGDVVHASPAIADGVVFIGSWDSYFYALDAATGAEKWLLKTGEDAEIHNQVGIQSSAAVVDGVVYFGCRDSHLYAVDARRGEKKWAFSTKESWVISSPAVKGGKVYLRRRIRACCINWMPRRGRGLLAEFSKVAYIFISRDCRGPVVRGLKRRTIECGQPGRSKDGLDI